MGYQFENVKLEKGMYNEAGRSFTKVLEKCDPSEQYQGTPLEKLDAFRSGMEALLGPGMCHVLRVRPQGGCVVVA